MEYPDDPHAQADIQHLENLGHIVALELLLRTLWTERSLQAKDPEKFIFDAIEGMCASMSEKAPPNGSAEEFVYDQAEARLRDFLQNVETRIRAHLLLRKE